MKTRVIVQARLASSRLPGKSLLPIAGIPLAVLCARRAGNTGLPVVLATCAHPEEDPLAQEALRAGITVVRGDRDNVLGRFVAAAAGLEDHDVVVRLTGDNALPDGPFIQGLVARMVDTGAEYLGTSSPDDGLPYGLSAEAFTAGALRRAANDASTVFEREHVTPRMICLLRKELYRPEVIRGDLSKLRCTVDTFTDYRRIEALFDGVDDPVHVQWSELVDRLSAQVGLDQWVPTKWTGDQQQSTLVLGTAQWGMPYGRANTTGVPDDRSLENIVNTARAAGVNVLDTAQAYGMAEERIGGLRKLHAIDGWHVTTKLDPLADVDASWPAAAIIAHVRGLIYRTCRLLRCDTIDTLLLHRESHLRDFGGVIWDTLRKAHQDGLVARIGVSVQTPAELVRALDDRSVGHVQMPTNILDWRWRSPDVAAALAERRDVIIHVRSSLLQGVLASPAEVWPAIDGVDPTQIIQALDTIAIEAHRRDRIDLCLAYVRGQRMVHGVVVGIETEEQLERDIEYFRKPELTDSELSQVLASVNGVPEQLLNPALWPAMPAQR